MNTMTKVMLLGIGLFCASCCCKSESGLERAKQKTLKTYEIDLTDGKVMTLEGKCCQDLDD